MSLKSLNIPSYKPSKEELQIRKLHRKIDDMGYDYENEQDIVKIIEKDNLDVSQFEFPGGSFESYKQDVLDGKYDLDMSCFGTEESDKQLKRDLKSGKLFVKDADEEWERFINSIKD